MKKPVEDQTDPAWKRVKQTVTPLRPNSSKPATRKEFEALMRVKPEPRIKNTPQQNPPELNQDKKVRRGRVEIDKKIDLHDLTKVEAERALRRALVRAYNQNLKTLLVVTGKGVRLQGVLRQAFPKWMNDPDIRPIIASYSQAHIRHGGSGAWYIFLKR